VDRREFLKSLAAAVGSTALPLPVILWADTVGDLTVEAVDLCIAFHDSDGDLLAAGAAVAGKASEGRITLGETMMPVHRKGMAHTATFSKDGQVLLRTECVDMYAANQDDKLVLNSTCLIAGDTISLYGVEIRP